MERLRGLGSIHGGKEGTAECLAGIYLYSRIEPAGTWTFQWDRAAARYGATGYGVAVLAQPRRRARTGWYRNERASGTTVLGKKDTWLGDEARHQRLGSNEPETHVQVAGKNGTRQPRAVPSQRGGSATTARPPVIPPPIQRHVAESQTPVSRRRSLPQTRKLAHGGNLGTSQMRQRKRNDILHTGWGRAKLQDGARLHYTLKSANPAAGLIPLPSPSVHLAGAWGSALGSGGRRASPPRFLSRGYLSPSVRSPRCTCDASQRGGGSIGSAGAPGGDFSQFRAAGPIQVNNERHRSPGRISAQRRKVQRPARREETRRCDRWMSASWVHAMYSGGTFRQRGTASLPASSFFFSFFSLPPETPEGGEEANPKGRKPLRPRSFPPRWLGGPAQWTAPHGRGAPHRHHARAPSFRLCGLSENPTGGYVGTLGVDSVEVATRATHCTLTLSFLPCPEHPTPPAQDPSTGPRAQDPAGAPIHQSSGTLRDSPAVTSSDVKPTSPLADDVACTLHQRPSRRIDAISARVPLFAPPPTLDHRQGLRLLAQSLTTRDITEQQNLGNFPSTPGI